MAGGTQLVGEGADARRQALGVVEEQDLGHGTSGGIVTVATSRLGAIFDPVVDTTRHVWSSQAFEKSQVDGMTSGEVPIAITITFGQFDRRVCGRPLETRDRPKTPAQ